MRLHSCVGIGPGTVVRENGGAQESGSTKNHALVQWFKTYSEEEELKCIASMRKKVSTRPETTDTREYSLVGKEHAPDFVRLVGRLVGWLFVQVAVQMREMQRRLALADAEVQSLRASAAS